MSLTALAHRKGVGVVPASNSPFHILDAVYTALTAANDYNGVAFPAPLVGVTKFTAGGPVTEEAIYGTFTTSAKTYKFLIAAASVAKNPLMAGSHTWLANCILSGGCINAGAFATWDHATQPFTSGGPTGLMRTLDTATTTCVKVYAIITAETLHIYYETNTGTILGTAFGALIDPESTSGNSAESDGRVYGTWVGGSAGAMSATQNAISATSGSMFEYTAGNGREHFFVHNIGASTTRRGNRNDGLVSSTTTSLASPDNEPYAFPSYVYDPLGGQGLGRLREICVTRDAKYGFRAQISGVDKWFYISGSTGVDQDAMALLC